MNARRLHSKFSKPIKKIKEVKEKRLGINLNKRYIRDDMARRAVYDKTLHCNYVFFILGFSRDNDKCPNRRAEVWQDQKLQGCPAR